MEMGSNLKGIGQKKVISSMGDLDTVYNAEISAGSLLVPESRKLARIWLTDPTEADWRKVLVEDNILQKKSPATALRQAKLIRNRLATLDKAGIAFVADGESEVVKQILFIACLKHSRLLRDFVSDTVIDHIKSFEPVLSVRDWDAFLAECGNRDPSILEWSITTKNKLLQVILRILAEVRFIESSRSLKIRRVQIHPAIKQYLEERNEWKLMNLMELKR